eukprot:GILK01028925.1.p2 GENE.GILK01028925.1~~GILK01028925.1.p2  ORF type:complete len:120 (-),score=12.46 GILK01028925.1:58-417(-)
MHHFLGMNVIERQTKLKENELDLVFLEVARLRLARFDLLVEIPSIGKLHDNEQDTIIFGVSDVANDVRVGATSEALDFVGHKATVLSSHVIGVHQLCGVDLTCSGLFDAPGASEATLPE